VVCEKRGRGGEKEFKKEGETSREERPMILTPKRQTLSKNTNRQNNVCKFNIKFFGPICPAYNIQTSKLDPCYREKCPLI